MSAVALAALPVPLCTHPPMHPQFSLYSPCVHPTPSSPQVFTIHNMDFGQIKLGEAAYYCQKFTTVSPSYAWEVRGTAAEEQLRTGVTVRAAVAHL